MMRRWSLLAACLALLVMQPAQGAADGAALVDAAAAGDVAAVRRLLDRHVPVDARSRKGKTALIAASQHGHTDLVRLLLGEAAAVNARTHSGSTAFYYAAQNHHVPVLKLLRAAGAEVNTVNRNGFSALTVAALNGDEEVVRLVLGYGADANARAGGNPILIEILGRGHGGIFRALLDAGADVNVAVAESGYTTLMIGAALQRTAAIRLLLARGADIRARAVSGKTVLHGLLCSYPDRPENTGLLTLLLEKGAEPDRPSGGLVGFAGGTTPLLCAVRRGYLQSVQALLVAQVDVNRRDKEGRTALYYAVQSDNTAMVRALLEHGADPARDADVQAEARFDTDIGRLILAALQPVLEARAPGDCPRFVYSAVRPGSGSRQPAPDPLRSEDFPAARVAVIEAIPPVADPFSLSPDGQWLVVREDHHKTPRLRSRRLVVYALTGARTHFLEPPVDGRVREDGWLPDSRRYVVGEERRQVIDFAGGRPRWRTLATPLSRSERLYAGSDLCPWRNDRGQVVLERPDKDDMTRAWSADGTLEYFLEAGEQGEYLLMARRGKVSRPLVRHRVARLRAQRRAMMLQSLPADRHEERREFEKRLGGIPLETLAASRFALAPGGRYLFYRIGQSGGPGFLGLADRNIVVDVRATPARAWVIEAAPWGTPQWHPNGRDLYFIDQQASATPDPDFPPMRQPRRWRLAVARFP